MLRRHPAFAWATVLLLATASSLLLVIAGGPRISHAQGSSVVASAARQGVHAARETPAPAPCITVSVASTPTTGRGRSTTSGGSATACAQPASFAVAPGVSLAVSGAGWVPSEKGSGRREVEIDTTCAGGTCSRPVLPPVRSVIDEAGMFSLTLPMAATDFGTFTLAAQELQAGKPVVLPAQPSPITLTVKPVAPPQPLSGAALIPTAFAGLALVCAVVSLLLYGVAKARQRAAAGTLARP